MVIKKFRPWTPDIAPLLGGSQFAQNTIPVEDGYAQMPVPIRSAPDGFNTIPYRLFVATASDGSNYPLCFGKDYSALARNEGWVTLANSTFVSESWDAVTWGDTVYAVNGREPYQKFDLLTGLALEPVATPNGLTGKRIAIVADFIMLIDIRENLESTRYPFRAQWSGLQRPERFDLDPAIQSDYQDVTDIGQLQAILGGEYGLILGTKGTTRVDYVAGDTIFTFQTVEMEVGCDIPNSAVRVGEVSIWHSRRGWRKSTGGVSQPIGAGICDRYFANRIDMDKIDRLSYTIFPEQDIVLYSYVSKYSIDGEPDEALAYNWKLKQFTPGKFRCAILGHSATLPVFSDDPFLPLPDFDPETSMSDDFYVISDSFASGSNDSIAAVVDGTLAVLGYPSGDKIELETEEIELKPGWTSKLVRFRPVVNEVGNVFGKVRARDIQTDSVKYRVRDNLRTETDGSFKCNERGRYHTIGLTVITPMKKGIGVDVIDVFPTGKR